jgi:hypothetical protein
MASAGHAVEHEQPLDHWRIVALLERCPFLWYRWYPFVDHRKMMEFHAARVMRAHGSWRVATVITERGDDLTNLLQIEVSEWDTAHFGLRMAGAAHVYSAPPSTGRTLDFYQDLLTRVDEACRRREIEHCSVAVDDENMPLIQAASLAGFVPVAFNTNHFFVPSKSRRDLPRDTLTGHVRLMQPGDLEVIAGAARKLFRFTRFHADPWLERAKADELYKHRLIQLTQDATTARVYVVEREGRPVALMPVRAFEEAGIRVAILDLTVILPEAAGLYYHLLLHALHDVDGVDVIEMSTDLRNLVVRNTWAKLGLQTSGARVYLHKLYVK